MAAGNGSPPALGVYELSMPETVNVGSAYVSGAALNALHCASDDRLSMKSTVNNHRGYTRKPLLLKCREGFV